MALVISIRFRENGKVYDFAAGDMRPMVGDYVMVETARGTECGEVMVACHDVPDEKLTQPLKPVLRKATAADVRQAQENREKERRALATCQQKIEDHGLEMKLVDAEYAFDNSKILFYFTADGRVDFRELVKDLAGVFRTRIELRQIGVRDEAKMLGGIGICGRPFCCAQFLSDFQPVSIKMAKEQSLSLNPTKISGSCGRLMCCLKYEQSTYEELLRMTPRVGAVVSTAEGKGVVVESNTLSGVLRVRLDKAVDSPPIAVHREEVTVLRSNRAKSAEEVPDTDDVE